MIWPPLSAYSDAVQIPPDAFADPALRQGVVETTQLGLPKARTGNFACVFKVRAEGRDWAVRCFLRPIADQQERYAVISEHLRRARLPYMASFEYQPNGIKVDSSRFPILKMEWVDGEPLAVYIQQHLNDAATLQALASRWLALVNALRGQQVAHGDLQHGNILVCGDDLRLVDYDGMYVPGLQGRQSAERGHSNYQHPNRADRHFGPYLDNFSAWVIYASILALAVDPSLWHQLDGGDEKLLFREADFQAPTTSLAFQLLGTCGNQTVEEVVARIRTMLSQDILALQPLEEVVRVVEGPSEEKGEWWRDYLPPRPPVRLMAPPLWERLAVLSISVAGGLVTGATVTSYSSSTAPAAVGSAILVTAFLFLFPCLFRFRRLPEVSARAGTIARLDSAKVDLRAIERSLASLREEGDRMGSEEETQLVALTDRQREARGREGVKLAEIEKELSAVLGKLVAHRASLDKQQVEELGGALNKIQEDYVARAMAGYHLGDANLQGIGDELKRRLVAEGIKTAADIEDIYVGTSGWGRYTNSVAYIRVRGRGQTHVAGIGPSKVQSLKGWWEKAKAKCRGGMPNSLPGQLRAEIVGRFDKEKRRLVGEETTQREAARQRKEQILKDSRLAQDSIDREVQKVRATRASLRANLDQKMKGLEVKKSQKEKARSELERLLDAHKNVTFARFLRAYFGA